MTTQKVTLGLDVGPVGRGYRLAVGCAATAVGVIGVATDDGVGPGFVALMVAYVAALAVFYLALHGSGVLGRVDPFVAAVMALLPLGLLAFVPQPMGYAVQSYVGMSLLVAASIGYGGCEVVALPSVLFGRRYVVYCPINVLDAAERPMRRSGDALLRTAAVIALVVGGYYLIVDKVLGRFEVSNPVPHWVALVLLVPAIMVGVRAWQARSAGDAQRAFVLGLGALALVGGALIFADVVHDQAVFGAAVLVGLALAGYRKFRSTRTDRSPDAGPAPASEGSAV